jgi:hypothetical protein
MVSRRILMTTIDIVTENLYFASEDLTDLPKHGHQARYID